MKDEGYPLTAICDQKLIRNNLFILKTPTSSLMDVYNLKTGVFSKVDIEIPGATNEELKDLQLVADQSQSETFFAYFNSEAVYELFYDEGANLVKVKSVYSLEADRLASHLQAH